MQFPTLLKRSAPSKMLVWRRQSWARYLQATCALMALLLFLGFQKKIASRVSSFQFLGPDKLHNDILNNTLGVSFCHIRVIVYMRLDLLD